MGVSSDVERAVDGTHTSRIVIGRAEQRSLASGSGAACRGEPHAIGETGFDLRAISPGRQKTLGDGHPLAGEAIGVEVEREPAVPSDLVDESVRFSWFENPVSRVGGRSWMRGCAPGEMITSRQASLMVSAVTGADHVGHSPSRKPQSACRSGPP